MFFGGLLPATIRCPRCFEMATRRLITKETNWPVNAQDLYDQGLKLSLDAFSETVIFLQLKVASGVMPWLLVVINWSLALKYMSARELWSAEMILPEALFKG